MVKHECIKQCSYGIFIF